MIGRLAVLAVALIIGLASNALAGTHSDSFGEGEDIETHRWFKSDASAWQNGRYVRKHASVGFGEHVYMYLDGQRHDLVDLRVGSSASIRHDGTRTSGAFAMVEMCDDDVLPLMEADIIEFGQKLYIRSRSKTMATTVGTQAVMYRLRYGARATLDLDASASLGSDSVLAEMRGGVYMQAGLGTAYVIQSGDLEVELERGDYHPTRGDLDFDLRASGSTIGSWAKLKLKQQRQYIALIGIDGRARFTTIVTDDILPAVDKYLYSARAAPRPGPPKLAIAR
jgi:hypothetical protein